MHICFSDDLVSWTVLLVVGWVLLRILSGDILERSFENAVTVAAENLIRKPVILIFKRVLQRCSWSITSRTE